MGFSDTGRFFDTKLCSCSRIRELARLTKDPLDDFKITLWAKASLIEVIVVPGADVAPQKFKERAVLMNTFVVSTNTIMTRSCVPLSASWFVFKFKTYIFIFVVETKRHRFWQGWVLSKVLTKRHL